MGRLKPRQHTQDSVLRGHLHTIADHEKGPLRILIRIGKKTLNPAPRG